MDWAPRVTGASRGGNRVITSGLLPPPHPAWVVTAAVDDDAALQPTLWVDAASGDDDHDIADVRAGGGVLRWATIGRAAWGSTDRNAPVSGQAATAGDVVAVATGSYDFAGLINDRFGVVYNPVNQGTLGNYLTFRAIGVVVLSAPSANSPVIGSNSRNYVKWYADVSTGSAWSILCDGRGAATPTTTAAGTVNTKPDTAPVVVVGATGCWIEGVDGNGGEEIPKIEEDNFSLIRVENAFDTVCRNNRARHFLITDGSHGAMFVVYHSLNTLIEHNDGAQCNNFFVVKNQTGFPDTPSSCIVRYNRITDVDQAFAWSITEATDIDASQVYQNIVSNCRFAVGAFGAAGMIDADIFNNVFYNVTNVGGVQFGPISGNRFWNNIIHTAGWAIFVEGGTMQPEASLDLEHNVYFNLTVFYQGTDGTLNFNDFNLTYSGQNASAPISVTSDPLFVNAAAGDFHLQVGSPARDLGRTFAGVTVHAGCYISGTETIGRET